MDTAKAIVAAGAIIGVSILFHLGYTVLHDRGIAEAMRREQNRQTQIAADNYRKTQSKEAWKIALKFIDVDFRKWLEKELKPGKDQYVNLKWASTKVFDLADIQWIDGHTIVVHSVLIGSFGATEKISSAFSWTRRVILKGDGVDTWWQAEDPAFHFAKFSKDQSEHMKFNFIFTEGVDLPLVR